MRSGTACGDGAGTGPARARRRRVEQQSASAVPLRKPRECGPADEGPWAGMAGRRPYENHVDHPQRPAPNRPRRLQGAAGARRGMRTVVWSGTACGGGAGTGPARVRRRQVEQQPASAVPLRKPRRKTKRVGAQPNQEPTQIVRQAGHGMCGPNDAGHCVVGHSMLCPYENRVSPGRGATWPRRRRPPTHGEGCDACTPGDAGHCAGGHSMRRGRGNGAGQGASTMG